MVIKTIAELDPQRKCFRMVGGVLVERTIQDVVPGKKCISGYMNRSC